MKRFYISKLAILAVILLGWNTGASAQSVSTFNYTGSQVAWVVPNGIYSIVVDMQGGSGGSDVEENSGHGGYGGRVQCTLTTTPGSTLYFNVGGAGANSPFSFGSFVVAGGFNGGGNGHYSPSGGGGGASDIRTVSGNLSSRLVVAGGGAGGGYGYCGCGSPNTNPGGNGGGLTGATGWFGNSQSYSGTCYNPTGGSQIAGGVGIGSCTNGQTNGVLGIGGDGPTGNYGGGGGGGYYGGGGAYDGGGGGGSSYTDPVLATGVTHTQGYNTTVSNPGIITFTSNCTPPVAGTIKGPAPICGTGGSYLFSDPTGSAGGLWSSSNTNFATIDPNTGILTATGTGTTVISYNIVYQCGTQTPSLNVTVNPIPAPISGTAKVCQSAPGNIAALSDGAGTWSSSNTGLATVSSTGLVTGVLPGNPIITYTETTGCTVTTVATVNPSPAPITGNTAICYLSTSQLSDISAGGIWSSSAPPIASVSASGLVTAMASSLTVQVTNINYTFATGCSATTPVSVNPLPTNEAIYVPGPTTSYCGGPLGTTGVDVKTSPGSVVGTNYQLYNSGVPYKSSFPGTGSVIDFGNLPAGNYTCVATNAATGCSKNMPGSVLIIMNAPPTIDTLMGGGAVCNGNPYPDIFVQPSQTGVNYQLMSGGVAIGGTVPGTTGFDADFGNGNGTGVYTATATDGNGCMSNMYGTVSVTINALPGIQNVMPLSGVGSMCPGGSVHIQLQNSVPGVDYTLYYNGSATAITVPGSSSALDFGPQFFAGTYTVMAANHITGCSQLMNGSVVLTINPSPNVYTLMGTGAYCSGGTGINDTLSGSDAGIEYYLSNGGVVIDSFAGTGSAIYMNGLTMGGVYTSEAVNTSTGCSINMTGSGTVTINPLPNPYAIGGGGPYCLNGTGSDVTLSGSDLGISYQLYNGGGVLSTKPGTGSAIDFGLETTLGNYTVVATNTTTFCQSNMTGMVNIYNYPLPVSYNTTGGGNYCIGGTGEHVGLDFSGLGINYQLYLGGVPVLGAVLPGANAALDFGLKTVTGTYTIMGTNTTTGCSDTMAGSAVVTNSPPPNIYTVTAAASSYCAGGTGIDISLSGSDLGISYQFFNSGSPVGLPQTGTGLPLDFGIRTLPGTYTIVATNGASSCTSNMFGSAPISINPLPTIYPVTGGGSYCSGGTGLHVDLSNSATGIGYQLFNGGTPVGSVMPGTGSSIDFGAQTTSGSYTVVATNGTTTCTNNMSGSAVINVNPLPNPYPVNGGGIECAGGTGYNLGLNGSDVGITYQLYNGGAPVGSPVPGSNIAIDFGIYNTAGVYTVKATNTASGCMANMTGSKNIIINPNPAAYTVYGGGAFCAGGSAHVYLSGSAFGDNYQLYNTGVATGGTVTATGGFLDFGAQTIGGTYTVVATDAITGCTSNMTSGTSITVNPLPAAYTVTGGGGYCAGGAGAPVGLSWSVAGINYQLYDGFTPVTSMPGAGIVLNFGPQTGAGVYTVVATDMVTGCAQTMTGSETVTVNPNVTPGVSITTSTGEDTVCEGVSIAFTAMPVNGGATPSYIWYVNGAGMATGDIFNYVPSNGDVVRVVMTSDAACLTSPTALNTNLMYVKPFETPSATMTINPGPSVCHGTATTYMATPVNGGFSPVYNWLVNSMIVASGTTNFSYVPADGDVVIFMLGSSYPCRLADSVFSNTYKMSVDPGVSPIVNITARPGTLVMPGEFDTLTANATSVGTDPTYQWSRNGAVIPGATDMTFIDQYYYNNDSISCEVTSSLGCHLSSYNSLVLQVKNVGVQNLAAGNTNISVIPNPNKGSFVVKGSIGTADEAVTLEITNMLGQVVYNSKVMAQGGNINEQVRLSNTLANGMYLLNLRTETATMVFHFVMEQ